MFGVAEIKHVKLSNMHRIEQAAIPPNSMRFAGCFHILMRPIRLMYPQLAHAPALILGQFDKRSGSGLYIKC